METAVSIMEKVVSISSKEQWAHKVRQGETRMQFISIAMGGDALFLRYFNTGTPDDLCQHDQLDATNHMEHKPLDLASRNS